MHSLAAQSWSPLGVRDAEVFSEIDCEVTAHIHTNTHTGISHSDARIGSDTVTWTTLDHRLFRFHFPRSCCPSPEVMKSTRALSCESKTSCAVTPIDLVQSLRPAGHFKRPITPSGDSPHTLMIQNTPLGGSLLGTTLYDRICKNQEPALLSPQVYKNELFGRPYLAIGGDFDTIHSAHALRLKSSAAAPGPNTFVPIFSRIPPRTPQNLASYQPPKMPAIKGGSFGRAFHKSEIEGMIERAAGAPGPGEVIPLAAYYRVNHSGTPPTVACEILHRTHHSKL